MSHPNYGFDNEYWDETLLANVDTLVEQHNRKKEKMKMNGNIKTSFGKASAMRQQVKKASVKIPKNMDEIEIAKMNVNARFASGNGGLRNCSQDTRSFNPPKISPKLKKKLQANWAQLSKQRVSSVKIAHNDNENETSEDEEEDDEGDESSEEESEDSSEDENEDSSDKKDQKDKKETINKMDTMDKMNKMGRMGKMAKMEKMDTKDQKDKNDRNNINNNNIDDNENNNNNSNNENGGSFTISTKVALAMLKMDFGLQMHFDVRVLKQIQDELRPQMQNKRRTKNIK